MVLIITKLFLNIKKILQLNYKNFVLDANIRIKSRPVSCGGYGPDIDFISGPDMDFKLDVSVKGFFGGIIGWFVNTFQKLSNHLL